MIYISENFFFWLPMSSMHTSKSVDSFAFYPWAPSSLLQWCRGSVCNWTNIMIRLPSQVLDFGVMIRLRFCEWKLERKKEACNYTFLILWWALNSAPSTMEMSFLGFNNVHDEFPPRASLIIKGRGYTDLLSYYLNADFIERLNHLLSIFTTFMCFATTTWLLKKAPLSSSISSWVIFNGQKHCVTI